MALISPVKVRQLQRTLNNLRVTLLCGILTILVLRGTIGAGRFGTPAQDFQQLRSHLPSRMIMNHPQQQSSSSRVLSEAIQHKSRSADEPQLHFHSFQPRIRDWDSQRTRFNQHRSSVNNTILLVTGSQPSPCDNPVGDHYLLKSLKNKLDYCRLHDLKIFYNMAHLDSSFSGYWAKLPLLRRLMLAHPDAEWLWWMDSDAIITDMSFELPLESYTGHDMILHGWDELVYEKKNWIGLNTGSFLLRNSQWSLDLLDAWAPMGPKGRIRDEAGRVLTRELTGRPEFEADDQSALVHLLATSGKGSQWGERVFLENRFYLHGFWAILVERFEEMMEGNHPGSGDDRWPLVTHFVGCKPCGSYGDYPVERCLKEMERAFNFGDNQVLGRYGFEHQELGSTGVKRVRNESDQPVDELLNSIWESKSSSSMLPFHSSFISQSYVS